MDGERDAEAAALGEVARIVAFDVGQRRIGVAITDGLGLTAQPLLTIYCKTPRADM